MSDLDGVPRAILDEINPPKKIEKEASSWAAQDDGPVQPQPQVQPPPQPAAAQSAITGRTVAKIALGGVAAIGAAAVIAPGALIVGPVLGFFGFSSGGVIAGSIAAGVQGMIGNVAAGSLFAICQSAAAGGAGAAVLTGAAAQAGGVVAAVAATAAVALNESGKKAEEDENGDNDGENGDGDDDDDDDFDDDKTAVGSDDDRHPSVPCTQANRTVCTEAYCHMGAKEPSEPTKTVGLRQPVLNHSRHMSDIWRNTGLGAAAVFGIVTVAAPRALVVAPVLRLLGFRSRGIVPGSIAAGLKSKIGNVPAGSLFAIAESAGAAGAGAAVLAGAARAGGALVATAAVAAASLQGGGEEIAKEKTE
ncbi:hypothetical protein QBC43DRAFT_373515 [Cladorrhinum sp. PSN259]|nr:hypothetical protein QBC43DRAFT_373515 [Cladorrhinum sp. PSN259]